MIPVDVSAGSYLIARLAMLKYRRRQMHMVTAAMHELDGRIAELEETLAHIAASSEPVA